MASLISALKEIGKGVEDVGKWIDDAIKFAEPIIGVLDPPLLPVLEEIDQLLNTLEHTAAGTGTNGALSPAALQALVQGTMVAHSIKAAAAAAATPAPTPGKK